jgi:amino acid adenylation domain-containing protein
MNKPERMCVHDLVAATAAATPDAIAVVAGDRQLTYRNLSARVNRLARFLRGNGVGPDVLVGLSLNNTVELLVGILGILKAGGAYVPMDPSYPAERLRFMMRDSRAEILVTTADLAKTTPVTDVKAIQLDVDRPYIEKESPDNFDSDACSDNLSYVIYTSGSTGKPKGVMVTHSSLVNYLLWAAKAYGPEAGHSALVHSSISFDLTITGLFTPLLLGGRVELVPEVDGLLTALRGGKKYGLVKITPTHLTILNDNISPDQLADKIGIFVIGGENLTAESVRCWREFSPNTRLINEYGPTETVVGCCAYEVGPSDPYVGSVPIGTPINSTQLYVLDEKQEMLPTGAAGELYIGGAGVARGYLNLPQLTKERFLPDPFSGRLGARMYRTGDLVRRRETGTFEYLGRFDDQVKLRGYRIELGEVEATIAEHPAIRQSAAMLQTQESGHKRLLAYAVPRENHAVSQAELREFISQRLPNYMVPSAIVLLEALPLTRNGKVDRHALPAPEKQLLPYSNSFTRPPDDVESKLVAIFTKLFGAKGLSATANFFDLGGDSLQMIALLTQIEKTFGQHVSIATLFESPMISQLADVLRSQSSTQSELIPVQAVGHLPPFFCFGAGPLFRLLATRLGTERPFLSVAPNRYSATFMQLHPSYKIKEIAEYAARIICDYQSEGPYYLGGWSASGVVAYEIAQNLMAKGHEVRLLVLFDVKQPSSSPKAFKAEWLNARREKVKFLANELKDLQLQNVHRYMGEKTASLRQRVRRATWKLLYPVRSRLRGSVIKNEEDFYLAALVGYEPKPYSGRVVFFNAASRPEGRAWDFSQGWRTVVTGRFDVHEIPGDHRSIFLEPNVRQLAETMTKYLTTMIVVFGNYNLSAAWGWMF